MKHLHLLRHAKSSWDDESLPDHDRPLAPRGERASALIAEHLRREAIEPELVLCSSSRRTRETLERVRPGGEVVIEEGIYDASARELLRRLHRLPDGVGSVMVIGHNPGIQALAGSLAREGEDLELMRDKFPTGALASLALDGSWADLAEGGAWLEAFGARSPGHST